MDSRFLLSCPRYIENNPVRAKLVKQPEQWVWSSAAAHISGRDDKLVSVDPVLSIISGDWRQFLAGAILTEEIDDIRRHGRTGRPLGETLFVEQLEGRLGRRLRPQKPGRKPMQTGN